MQTDHPIVFTTAQCIQPVAEAAEHIEQLGFGVSLQVGTGVDSNMFVRIMAPLSQSEKFAAGDYIREYVPELAQLSDPYIHDPEAHGCRPRDYPAKIIAHREGRDRALAAYRNAKG